MHMTWHNTRDLSEVIIHVPKVYNLPELDDIFLKVAAYFESCMIYLTKLNNTLKVV